jgi:hypothetical protein
MTFAAIMGGVIIWLCMINIVSGIVSKRGKKGARKI